MLICKYSIHYLTNSLRADCYASYDGDEPNNDTKANVVPTSESKPAIPVVAEVKDEPGYGEEPDTAGPPQSFEEDVNGGHDEMKEEHSTYTGQDFDIPRSTMSASHRDEPLQMKDDG